MSLCFTSFISPEIASSHAKSNKKASSTIFVLPTAILRRHVSPNILFLHSRFSLDENKTSKNKKIKN